MKIGILVIETNPQEDYNASKAYEKLAWSFLQMIYAQIKEAKDKEESERKQWEEEVRKNDEAFKVEFSKLVTIEEAIRILFDIDKKEETEDMYNLEEIESILIGSGLNLPAYLTKYEINKAMTKLGYTWSNGNFGKGIKTGYFIELRPTPLED